MQKEAHSPCEAVISKKKSPGPLQLWLFYSSCNSEAPPGLESGSESVPFENSFFGPWPFFACVKHSGRHFPCAGAVNPHIYQKGVMIMKQTSFNLEKSNTGAGRKNKCLRKDVFLECLLLSTRRLESLAMHAFSMIFQKRLSREQCFEKMLKIANFVLGEAPRAPKGNVRGAHLEIAVS